MINAIKKHPAGAVAIGAGALAMGYVLTMTAALVICLVVIRDEDLYEYKTDNNRYLNK